jgi:hypothetical protein
MFCVPFVTFLSQNLSFSALFQAFSSYFRWFCPFGCFMGVIFCFSLLFFYSCFYLSFGLSCHILNGFVCFGGFACFLGVFFFLFEFLVLWLFLFHFVQVSLKLFIYLNFFWFGAGSDPVRIRFVLNLLFSS